MSRAVLCLLCFVVLCSATVIESGYFKIKFRRPKCANGQVPTLVRLKAVEFDPQFNDYENCGECTNGCECTFPSSTLNDVEEDTMNWGFQVEVNGCGLSQTNSQFNVQDSEHFEARRCVELRDTPRGPNLEVVVSYTLDNILKNEIIDIENGEIKRVTACGDTLHDDENNVLEYKPAQ